MQVFWFKEDFFKIQNIEIPKSGNYFHCKVCYFQPQHCNTVQGTNEQNPRLLYLQVAKSNLESTQIWNAYFVLQIVLHIEALNCLDQNRRFHSLCTLTSCQPILWQSAVEAVTHKKYLFYLYSPLLQENILGLYI